MLVSLTLPPSNRFPTLVLFSFEEIESLSFFSALDWSSIHNHPVPFVPRPDDITDTTYFNGKSNAVSLHTRPRKQCSKKTKT